MKGKALNEIGRYEEAKTVLEQALIFDPENAVAKEIRDEINQNLNQKTTQIIQSGSQPSNPCIGSEECGDTCCSPDEKCCETRYHGPMCYDPLTHLCRNGDLQTVWGEQVLPPVQFGMGVPSSSNQPKKNKNTATGTL